MLEFSPSQPFPLVQTSSHTLSEVRAHSEAVDRWLGFASARIEERLAHDGSTSRKASAGSGEKQQLWFGLDPQLLLTPYVEIRALLSRLNPQPGETIVDLGAAYGRMGLVIARHFPKVNFVGYEYVWERVAEGRRVFAAQGLDPETLEHRDLSAPRFSPVEADVYFLYDFGTLKAIEKSLYDLKRIAQSRPITVIGRGRHCRALIASRHAWLRGQVSPHGEERATIYLAGESSSNLRCMTA